MPSRALTDAEVRANIAHFTVGRDTPRTRPCTRLALSGLSSDTLDPQVIAFARDHGVERIVLHGRAPALESLVDSVSVKCSHAQDVGGPSHTPWTAIVPLTAEVLLQLPAVIAALMDSPPERVVLAWPFPGDGVRLPEIGRAVEQAGIALQALQRAGVRGVLRGLPPCLDGSDEGRTNNRFYVDADHQLADSLLWVPDVVQYLKPDSCRVCRKSPVCDGVVAQWLEGGGVGPLEPVSDEA